MLSDPFKAPVTITKTSMFKFRVLFRWILHVSLLASTQEFAVRAFSAQHEMQVPKDTRCNNQSVSKTMPGILEGTVENLGLRALDLLLHALAPFRALSNFHLRVESRIQPMRGAGVHDVSGAKLRRQVNMDPHEL